MIAERVRRRYEHLCKLADRPGTKKEGETARFILRRMLEKYPELGANLPQPPPLQDGSTLEWRERGTSVTRYPHAVCVGLWAPCRYLKIAPVRADGLIVACTMIDGSIHFVPGRATFELLVNGATAHEDLVQRSRTARRLAYPVACGDELLVTTDGHGRRSLEIHFSFTKQLRGTT